MTLGKGEASLRGPLEPMPMEALEVDAINRVIDGLSLGSGWCALPSLAEGLGERDLKGRVRDVDLGWNIPFLDAALIAMKSKSSPGTKSVAAIPLADAVDCAARCLGREMVPGGVLTSGEQGVLLYLADRFAGDWLDMGGRGFEVRGLLADPGQVEAYLGSALRWTAHLEFRSRGFGFEAALFGAGCGVDTGLEPCPDLSDSMDWIVDFRLIVGRARLEDVELGGLETGDLVVLDNLAFPYGEASPTEGAMTCGEFSRTFRFVDDRRLEITGRGGRSSEENMDVSNTTEVTATLTPSSAEASSMEVALHVEVGTAKMRVSSALGLVPGQVVSLDRPVTSDVFVRVGDRLVAKGELVEVDGELAVKIRESL